jgi:uncharacterized protein (TIGR02246 family)
MRDDMKRTSWLVVLILAPFALAQEAEVRAMMKDSEATWNRGDLAAFVSFYEDSPDTTFVGEKIVRGGAAALLDRYQSRYPTPEKRGILTFSDIEVRPLSENLAIVIGRFHLKRPSTGGGDASGRYSLVVRKGPSGWKIIHDHTSSP